MSYRIHAHIGEAIRTYEASDYQSLIHKVSVLDSQESVSEIIVYNEDTQQCYSRSMFSGDLQSSDKIKWMTSEGYQLKYGDLKP